MDLNNEVRVVGWLTLKQTVYLGIAALVVVMSFEYLEQRFAFIIVALVLVVLWKLLSDLKRPRITREYVQRKRSHMDQFSFEKWRQRMIADVVGHIEERKMRGLEPGPNNLREKEVLESFADN